MKQAFFIKIFKNLKYKLEKVEKNLINWIWKCEILQLSDPF